MGLCVCTPQDISYAELLKWLFTAMGNWNVSGASQPGSTLSVITTEDYSPSNDLWAKNGTNVSK